jgi:DNA-binding MarR family transcriptional regulator
MTPQVEWLDAEEQVAWRAWLDSSSRVLALLDRDLRTAGLTHTYYEILVRLSEAADHRLRMSELAQRSACSPSALSHAVTRLEREGFVARAMCPEDRRGQVCSLTDAGMARLGEVAVQHVTAVRRVFLGGMSKTQLRQLGAASAATLRHLDALGED